MAMETSREPPGTGQRVHKMGPGAMSEGKKQVLWGGGGLTLVRDARVSKDSAVCS